MRSIARFAFDSKYDFAYRPLTYWPDLPTEETILSRIKGTQRRDVAKRALEGEELERLGSDDLYRAGLDFVFRESLDEDARVRWGGRHPSMMGGEYLPDPEDGEVEIVRVALKSTTGDVFQLLAKRAEQKGQTAPLSIHFRVVDEYEDEGTRYVVQPEWASEPLSFGQLVNLMDTTREVGMGETEWATVGLNDRFLYNMCEADDESLLAFVRVSSPFYPQLRSYYQDRSRAWVEYWSTKGETPPW